jgi:predicted secreted hydrolase
MMATLGTGAIATACGSQNELSGSWQAAVRGGPGAVPTIVVARAADPPPTKLPPVRLPRDEGPHDVLAEWWYYTGHLYAPAGVFPKAGTREPHAGLLVDEVATANSASDDHLRAGECEYGFELVFFRGVRGDRPPGYAAHFAITDVDGGTFTYDERVEIALAEVGAPLTRSEPLPDSDPRPPASAITRAAMPALAFAPNDRPGGIVSLGPSEGGFDLSMGGWRMRGAEGRDRLWAAGPGYRIDLSLIADRAPALHDGDPPGTPGLISFGPAGYSYYYSRTRMAVTGTLGIGDREAIIRGTAWMDHQWGDFLVLGGGGWDWFSAHLVDGRDLTISVVRDETGKVVLSYGTLALPNGDSTHLDPASFKITPTEWWTSPHTGITYPSGWRIALPGHGIDAEWTPLVRDQELRTTNSTGVTYWEGTVRLRDSATGAFAGRGYVELTGYAKKA